MTPLFLTLLTTRPDRAWERIRQHEDDNSLHYLVHLLLLALIPSVCLFIGTTFVGWSLVDRERVLLDAGSAFWLCLLLYLTIIVGTALMGAFVRWMSRSFDTRPNLNQCIGFIAYTLTPFFLAGVAGLYPNRWFAAIVLLVAGVYSTYLLFIGLPTFMRQRSSQSVLFAASIWGVALLVLVTILVSMILLWEQTLKPEFQRSLIQDQGYPTQDERPREVPNEL